MLILHELNDPAFFSRSDIHQVYPCTPGLHWQADRIRVRRIFSPDYLAGNIGNTDGHLFNGNGYAHCRNLPSGIWKHYWIKSIVAL